MDLILTQKSALKKRAFWYSKTVMRILITAGGTAEKIDDVRRITNTGTGRLGAKVAERFAAAGAGNSITYICSENAVRPQTGGAAPGEILDVIFCSDVDSVGEAVRKACAETKFDVIVHSMAISDYRVRAVSDSALMTESVIERLSLLACGDSSSPEEAIRETLLSPPGISERKISSEKEDLVVVLEKAPKIIALFRGLAPNAVVVGFKLLSGAGEEELLRAGMALLEKNDCDFVFANDMETVLADRHEGFLIARDGSFEGASGKDGIAALIVERATELVSKR